MICIKDGKVRYYIWIPKDHQNFGRLEENSYHPHQLCPALDSHRRKTPWQKIDSLSCKFIPE